MEWLRWLLEFGGGVSKKSMLLTRMPFEGSSLGGISKAPRRDVS